MQTVLKIFYPVVQQKSVLYVDSISLNVRRFYYSTHKIIRIMFIVTVSVIHCRLCSSTNHNWARCHLHAPPPSIYSVTQSPTLAAESVAADSCQLIWPTNVVIGWLTNPRTAALLWLVVQDIPRSFALQLKIDPAGPPSLRPYGIGQASTVSRTLFLYISAQNREWFRLGWRTVPGYYTCYRKEGLRTWYLLQSSHLAV